MALIFAMLLGADSIDDCALLRAGRTRRLLGGWVPAPWTLRTFLRGCTFGHVRQLDMLLGQTLARATIRKLLITISSRSMRRDARAATTITMLRSDRTGASNGSNSRHPQGIGSPSRRGPEALSAQSGAGVRVKWHKADPCAAIGIHPSASTHIRS
jgi:hypothetical protein